MALWRRYFTAETSLGTVPPVSVSPTPSASSATAGVRSVLLRSGVYADSVRLMQVSREISGRDGVTAVLVAMATPLNLELAEGMGLAPDEGASPEQLLIAVRAEDDATLATAVAAVDAALAARERSTGSAAAIPQRTIGSGLAELAPDAHAERMLAIYRRVGCSGPRRASPASGADTARQSAPLA